VIFESTVPPGPDQQAVYVAGTALESNPLSSPSTCPERSVQSVVPGACTAEELTGEADLRLWVLRVDRWEVHISGARPALGSGTDQRTPVDRTECHPRPGPSSAGRHTPHASYRMTEERHEEHE
jgi:hypothetical protein